MEATVKSAEQKLTEKATEEYLSKLKAIYGEDATANIEIAGVKLSKLGHIAECAGIDIDKRNELPFIVNEVAFYDGSTIHYLRKPFAGNGYTITEISE